MDANALRDYQVADSLAYRTIAAAQATLDRDYWLAEVPGLVTMAASLASSYPSPWAVHYAAAQHSYASWSATTASAQWQKRVTQSLAQSTGEIGLANSERDSAVASAQADYDQTVSLADATFSAAQAQAVWLAAFGSTSNYVATYPALATIDDFTGVYVIATADSSAYFPNMGKRLTNRIPVEGG